MLASVYGIHRGCSNWESQWSLVGALHNFGHHTSASVRVEAPGSEAWPQLCLLSAYHPLGGGCAFLSPLGVLPTHFLGHEHRAGASSLRAGRAGALTRPCPGGQLSGGLRPAPTGSPSPSLGLCSAKECTRAQWPWVTSRNMAGQFLLLSYEPHVNGEKNSH